MPPKNQDDLKTIHTYQTDVEDAIEKEGISRSEILVSEQQKQTEEKMASAPEPKSTGFSFNFRAFSFAILFLAIAAGGLYYFLKTHPSKITPNPVIETNPEQSLISYDSYYSAKLSGLTREDLTSVINTEKGKQIQGVMVLSFGLASDQFLSLLSPNISGIFLRAIDQIFAFGFVAPGSQSGAVRSFLVLKVNSYSTARGSLLSEEKNIARELGDIFDIPNDSNLQFRDKVIENHDARILTDLQNNLYFLYSFIDSDTLVFAEDDDTFKTVIDRINSSKR